MEKVSIVSTDGHAVLPAELWPEYLEQRFHEYLPALRADDEINRRSMYPLNDAMMVPALDVFDTDGVYRAEGWKGAWDADVRVLPSSTVRASPPSSCTTASSGWPTSASA